MELLIPLAVPLIGGLFRKKRAGVDDYGGSPEYMLEQMQNQQNTAMENLRKQMEANNQGKKAAG